VLDVPVRAAEIPVEEEGDRLVDYQAAVRRELDDDRGIPQCERLRIGTRGSRKCSGCERRP
jgi:hypothetical protein